MKTEMKRKILVGMRIITVAFLFVMVCGCEKITRPDYKILGFGDVKLGAKTSTFCRYTNFMSFDKFGCKVTPKSSKCYSVYYMYEDSDYPVKEQPDIAKIISTLKEKYKMGGDYSSNPSPLFLLHGRWQDFCDSEYFSGKGDDVRDIEWREVFFLDDHGRSIKLCVSGSPRINVKSNGKFEPYDPSRPIPKRYRVLLFAYDWKLYSQYEEETAEKIKDGL